MRRFRCQTCKALVYFDNVLCLTCGSPLAFVPDLGVVSALQPGKVVDTWHVAAAKPGAGDYRRCLRFSQDAACNWLIAPGDTHEFCTSCRLSRTIPDLSQDELRACWVRLEAGKRNLLYGLAQLRLPVKGREQDPVTGLSFDFLAGTPDKPVLTGHDKGLITINVAEADDLKRERTRLSLGETYRTVIGSLRHEIGHYYWDVLIAGSPREQSFRNMFGDERVSYDGCMKRHYEQGAPDGWQQDFISAYASMHPWEDWAETWAHYLHLRDVIETGASFGLSLQDHDDEVDVRSAAAQSPDFAALIKTWMPLTYAINSLSRSMGQTDWYPFTMSDHVLAKMHYVHDVVVAVGNGSITIPVPPVAEPVVASPMTNDETIQEQVTAAH